MLAHSRHDCTGLWKQQNSGACMYWECEQCGAIADHSIEAAEAALRENHLGVTLRQLATAGDYLNLPESEEPWQW